MVEPICSLRGHVSEVATHEESETLSGSCVVEGSRIHFHTTEEQSIHSM